MAFIQRRINVAATTLHCIDVDATLFHCCAPAWTSDISKLMLKCYKLGVTETAPSEVHCTLKTLLLNM